ncbi:MAG: winged helix-turn-helix domain-containing protein [Candidatus Neomarinimicrobiota bacterium]
MKKLTKVNNGTPNFSRKNDNLVNNRLTMVNNIVDLLVKGLNQTQISKVLNVSRVSIHKHVKRLIADGKVRESPESNSKHKFYIVNHFSLGMRKNENYDLHNIEVTLPIAILGNLPSGNIDMGNWKYAKMKFDDFTIKVNYGKEPKIVIYPPKVYGNNIEEVLFRCGNKVTLIAVMIEKNFNCKFNLNEMKVRRRPHLHAFNDPIINKFDNEGIQYRGQNIEYNRSGDAHADILGFEGMSKYDQLLNTVPQLIQEFQTFKSMLGSIAHKNTQMFNLQAITTETLKVMKDVFVKGSFKPSMDSDIKPQQQEEIIKEDIINEPEPITEERETQFGKMIYIETLMGIPSFMGIRDNKIHQYPELKRGVKIWIEKQVARILTRQRKAKRI